MKNVWRVDNELLTIKEVEYSEKMPIGRWLPAMFGDGEYAYFYTYEEAEKVLVCVLDTKIEELTEMRNRLGKENK